MTAVILAAGHSRRFGKEKLLMEIDSKPMVLGVIELVMRMGFERTILVYRHEEVKRLTGDMDLECRYNAFAAEGLSTSVVCGIRDTAKTDAYMFFLGDQPFIDENTVTQLKNAYNERKGSIIIPRFGGQRGNPVIFDSAWKTELEQLAGDTGGRTIIEENPDKVHYVEIENKKAGLDIDTWEEYLRYRTDLAN